MLPRPGPRSGPKHAQARQQLKWVVPFGFRFYPKGALWVIDTKATKLRLHAALPTAMVAWPPSHRSLPPAGSLPRPQPQTLNWPCHPQALYLTAGAYVHPARAEGFGMTILQAMAAARPVIAPALGGHTDFASEETAFLVPARMATCTKDPCHVQDAQPDAVAPADAAGRSSSIVASSVAGGAAALGSAVGDIGDGQAGAARGSALQSGGGPVHGAAQLAGGPYKVFEWPMSRAPRWSEMDPVDLGLVMRRVAGDVDERARRAARAREVACSRWSWDAAAELATAHLNRLLAAPASRGVGGALAEGHEEAASDVVSAVL